MGRANGRRFYDDLSTTEQLFGDPAMPVFSKSSTNAAVNRAVNKF